MTFDEAVNKINKLTVENKKLKIDIEELQQERDRLKKLRSDVMELLHVSGFSPVVTLLNQREAEAE